MSDAIKRHCLEYRKLLFVVQNQHDVVMITVRSSPINTILCSRKHAHLHTHPAPFGSRTPSQCVPFHRNHAHITTCQSNPKETTLQLSLQSTLIGTTIYEVISKPYQIRLIMIKSAPFLLPLSIQTTEGSLFSNTQGNKTIK